jgi:hypothetical protein
MSDKQGQGWFPKKKKAKAEGRPKELKDYDISGLGMSEPEF